MDMLRYVSRFGATSDILIVMKAKHSPRFYRLVE